MDWLIIPMTVAVDCFLVWAASRALREPEEPPTPPCDHPWYIDGRCIVCGHPR